MNQKPAWMQSDKPACGNCKFAHFVGVPNLECRRHAPSHKAGVGGLQDRAYPGVNHEEWCGDHEADNGAQEAAQKAREDVRQEAAKSRFGDPLGRLEPRIRACTCCWGKGYYGALPCPACRYRIY